MRSLFLRILLWFGLAIIAAAVASFVVGVITERRVREKAPPHLIQALGVYSQTAAETFEREGAEGTKRYLDRVARAARLEAVLFDAAGNKLTSGPDWDDARTLVARTVRSMSFENSITKGRFLNAQPARSAGGVVYVLVANDLAVRDLGPPPGPLRFTLLEATRLIPVLLIGGLLCYLLAKHLSSPIEQLREVAQDLSHGRLQARVDQKLLARRDEIGELSRDFNLMAERIQSLVDAQRRLLGDISHELRSPLARQGVALGLARRRAGPDAASVLDRIEREGERINELIGQLLALSRVETGTDGLPQETIDLAGLVREVADDSDFEARSRDRSVTVLQAETATMRGLPDLLRSAVENVVRNGVRHTAANTAVEVSLTRETTEVNGFAAITVRDHGNGVPEDYLEEIFRPFYRVEPDRDRKTGGSGLGLSIAARAVRLHHGEIKASNASGGGLIVQIKLPITKNS
ncbi:MAG TPA: ATP-binding protein [Pyrinomonadaceae bacterium]|nr:ATP-binding protein [Pyrinomonadaceae bacterium]